jgi:phenylacetate-CoA ligase
MDESQSAIEYRAVLRKRHKAPWRGRLYPALQQLRGRPLGSFLRQLQDWEQLAPADFDRLHQERLAEILEFAQAHVPLYRTDPWRSALSAGETGKIDAWPVLRKETLRAHFRELQAEPPPPRIVTRRTSGWSGPRAKIAMTPQADTWGWAHRYRGLQWHGIPIGVPSLRLSHDRRVLRDLVKGEKCVPTPESPKAMESAVRYLLEKRPVLVTGPPSTLFQFSRHLRQRGVTEPLAPFARIGGEQLFDFQRNEIQSFLCDRAIDSYGSTETGALAGECPAGSLHIYADHVHLEIFDGDSPVPAGGLGDIVATTLRNTAMPLVRYRVGDRGRLSPKPCRCGLPHPVLMDLEARADDWYPGSDGSSHHSSELIGSLGDFFADPVAEQVCQIQFLQSDPCNWEARLEVTEKFLAAADLPCVRGKIEQRLTGTIRRIFGPACRVSLLIVDSLPRDSGKFRYIKSK